MSFRERIARLIVGKQAAVPFAGLGYSMLGGLMNTQRPGIDAEALLRAYGEDPWVYGAVSRIAQAVAVHKWHLNRIKPDGEKEEITDRKHELKLLLNKPNPMQDGSDLMELGEIYSLLTGKDYWRISKEKGKWELNLIPSVWLKPILDKSGIEILGYHYERGGFTKDFPAEEIIPFIHSDPLNPLDGIGPTHPIGIDILIHSYARQTNRNLFYRQADAGLIIKTEASDQTEINRMKEAWNAEHRSYGRVGGIEIFGGATEIIQKEMPHKDMHYPELMDVERKVMLASYGLPYTMLGGTDMVQRGNAEAAQYTFARWVIVPRL